MAACVTRSQSLTVGPDRVDLCNVTHDDTDEFDYFLEDDNGAVLSLAGWTAWTVTLRVQKGVNPAVAVPTSVVADIVSWNITPAHKDALASRVGWWELAALDPAGNPQILVNGTLSITPNVEAP